MRKYIVMLVVLAFLAISLVGCGPDKSKDPNPGQSNQTQTGQEGDKPAGVSEDEDLKIDTGRYVGQIDGNSIEIKVSGVPEENAARAYRLSDEVKNKFEGYGFKTDDVIKVKYKLNEYNQPVIMEMEKI